ncbi:hypothetical protein GW943_01410 [Candidatus Parcubacteria bacterium]|uniref:Ribulose-phosphate 3-epimerase n=1 Tax=Candidatus Kaiserbacteria bacterium CG10_big_fil_rev_8_21_14_0_10_47_16 TaxID=1974608 RepID=A0A2H0UE46_9BACT|nr:hypothetical protein [Candidatus Parcubacteria bacterium]PIR84694.1 MAG: hypothetical protein COU16_00710 [Candidatus Kaiserbacteria bacterium CG10_big_fil_rev_8_21_14_0_10_47_16]
MIIPAIIPTSRHALDSQLDAVSSVARQVQVDIVDGIFATPTSWPYICEDVAGALVGLDFRSTAVELDLMVKDPEGTLDMWLATHPAKMVVHVESTNNLNRVIEHANRHAYQLGLAFNNDTSLDVLAVLDRRSFDYVQLMGIATIGTQGQPFDERVIDRILFLKKTYPDLPIQIDGSVNMETISKLRRAGADLLVAGSAIFADPYPENAYRALAERAML